MTVLAAGAGEGVLQTVTAEQAGEHGEMRVQLAERAGLIHADLSVGANVAGAKKLSAMAGLSVNGMMRAGEGFLVTPDQATALGLGSIPGLEKHIFDFRNGRDLTDVPRCVKVIDAFGLTAEELRERFPATYQWLLERVKPERDQNNRPRLREQWWVFAEPRKTLRLALHGLVRYIATVETTKHRVFQFLSNTVLPEHKLVAIALDDAFSLGILSSQVHIDWALALGGRLGVGNDPVYSKSRCFDTFPFPDEDTGLTPALHTRIAHLAEQIDVHRKRVLGLPVTAPVPAPGGVNAPSAGGSALATAAVQEQNQPLALVNQALTAINIKANGGVADAQSDAIGVKPHQDVTLTGLYNVLQALRQGRALTAKEKIIHSHGLVGVLRELHDELDAAVRAAYGLPVDASTADTLALLLPLNARRAAEEAQGLVRWLRPAFQHPTAPQQAPLELLNKELPAQVDQGLEANFAYNSGAPSGLPPDAAPGALSGTLSGAASRPITAQPWPATLPEQVRAVAAVLTASPAPLSLSALEAHFKGRGAWKKGLPIILDTLAALGRAHCQAALWRGV